MWAIKSLLQLFEVASGLKVNFHKSHLVGINMDEAWLYHTSNFLNCKVGNLPFIYLGLPIVA